MNRNSGCVLSLTIIATTLAVSSLCSDALAQHVQAEDSMSFLEPGMTESARARIAEIAAARSTQPELFSVVAPYWMSDDDDPFYKLTPKSITWYGGKGRYDKRLRPLELKLLHADYHIAVTRYPEVFTEINTAVARARERALVALGQRTEGTRNTTVKEIQSDLKEELLETSRKHAVPRTTFNMLVEATGYRFAGLPRLDARYLLAWEEALLTADWPMKTWFVRIVGGIGDPRSLPVLGETLRQGLLRATPRDRFEKSVIDSIVFTILHDTFLKNPSEAAIVELSDTVRLAKDEKEESVKQRIGIRLGRSEEWLDLLDKHEKDPVMAEHVARLREAIRIYGNTEEKEQE